MLGVSRGARYEVILLDPFVAVENVSVVVLCAGTVFVRAYLSDPRGGFVVEDLGCVNDTGAAEVCAGAIFRHLSPLIGVYGKIITYLKVNIYYSKKMIKCQSTYVRILVDRLIQTYLTCVLEPRQR